MKRLLSTLLVGILFAFLTAHAAERAWQTGKLVEVEQEKVKEGSTKTTSSDGSLKDKGNKTEYSGTSTTTTSDNVDTYQVYTIQAADKVYVAKEKLLFPWSKPSSASVGDDVKFAVEKGKLYILDGDGKEHKATVTKTSMKPSN
jgi:hypothetical protein